MGKSRSYVVLGVVALMYFNTPVQTRGAVLGALSAANTTFSAPIELRESLKMSDGSASPYTKRSAVLASYAEGLTKIPVPESLGMAEAASLFGVWMKDKAFSGGM